jgi:N-acyl-phosphatidylethanolamine-hydrolysing phospholipase D
LSAVLPPHHVAPRGFINPWPTPERTRRHLLRWAWERARSDLPPNPPLGALVRVASEIARPRGEHGALRITWVGHSTFLIQLDRWNVLTDPHWSVRASPFRRFGPRRFVPPGIDYGALPPIDAVLISHDHYDHLDDATVRRLARDHEDAVWHAPLGYDAWFARRGVRHLVSHDWWQESTTRAGEDRLSVVAGPAQHWTSRTPLDRQRRLWASWSVRGSGERSIYFGGDSGWFPGYREIGRRLGGWDAVLLPIGAYEPRWFMAPAHMNPEEAVRAYSELGGTGTFVGMHWGTWRLTDEDPLEPPVRTRRAWHESSLPEDRLWIPRHGETRAL